VGRLSAVPILVVIVGPIASGKTAVAGGLGERFRSCGRRVAVLDLDELVETIGGFVGLSGERFRQAQVVFGQLVGAWLD
jgi:adenylylsulfate kinase-like enzyme